jgi:hypothetical protein
MVTIGADLHKRTHTLVAADAVGRELAGCTVKATAEGHAKALRWARRWDQRTWALGGLPAGLPTPRGRPPARWRAGGARGA